MRGSDNVSVSFASSIASALKPSAGSSKVCAEYFWSSVISDRVIKRDFQRMFAVVLGVKELADSFRAEAKIETAGCIEGCR